MIEQEEFHELLLQLIHEKNLKRIFVIPGIDANQCLLFLLNEKINAIVETQYNCCGEDLHYIVLI